MAKDDLVDRVLRLLPAAPDFVPEEARTRLTQLSRGELERMHKHLDAAVEKRSEVNRRRQRWEAAKAAAADASRLEDSLAALEEQDARVTAWLTATQVPPAARSAPAEAPTPAPVPEPQAAHGEAAPATPVISLAWQEAVLRILRDDAEPSEAADPGEVERFAETVDAEARISAMTLIRAGNDQGELSAEARRRMYALIPWRWFVPRMLGRFGKAGDPAFTDEGRNRFGRVLAVLRGQHAGSLYLSDSADDPDEFFPFAALVQVLWHFPREAIPPKIVAQLIPLLDVGAAAISRTSEHDTHMKLALRTRTIIRAYLLVTQIRKGHGRLDAVSRGRNLAPALLAAERAGLFATGSQLVDRELIDELVEYTDNVAADANTFLASLTNTKVRRFDLLLNAADVFRCRAQLIIKSSNDTEAAARKLEAAFSYYDAAHAAVEGPEDLRLFFGRRARTLLVKAELAHRRHEPAVAAGVLKTLVDMIDSEPIGRETGALQFLKFEALLSASRLAETAEGQARLEQELRNFAMQSPDQFGGWHLLVGFLARDKRDLDSALEATAQWRAITAERASPRSVEYVEYRAARLVFDTLEHDSSRLQQALRAYIDLMRSQRRNSEAFRDFCELLERCDPADLPEAAAYAQQAFRNGGSMPLSHALILGMLDAPLSDEDGSAARAVREALTLSGDEGALARLLARRNWADISMVENASVYWFRRGRRFLERADLAKADRLIQAGLRARPDDIVWLSRRIDIVLEERASDRAREMLEAALRRFPTDPIFRFQQARLELAAGRPAEASQILRFLVSDSASKAASEEHPAVIDQLALASLQEGRFEEARSHYIFNVDRQPLDPRGWLGLGRVSFEEGAHRWPDALQNWMKALHLQTDWNLPATQRSARRTASLIAGLFENRSNPELSMRFEQLIGDHPDLIRVLAPAFASRDVSNALAEKLMAIAATSGDLIARRQVSQFLRARTIFQWHTAEREVIVAQVGKHVAWAHEHGVLADYYAGAKGSYARALLRQTGLHEDHAEPDDNVGAASSASIEGLLNLVSQDGYISRYYPAVEDSVAGLGTLSVDSLADIALRSMSRTFETFRRIYGSPSTMLERIVPEKRWILPEKLGKLQKSAAPSVSAMADEDMLHFASPRMARSGWRSEGIEILRQVTEMPPAAELHALARGGIYFREEPDPTAYLNTLSSPSQSTFELEAVEAVF